MELGLNDYAFLGGVGAEAFAKYQSGSYKEKIAEINSEIANEQAESAMSRGRQQERQLRVDYSQLMGKQRAIMAAQGLNLEEDTALNVQLDTRRQEEIDVLTLRNNTAMEAWGYNVQAYNYTQMGKYAKREGDIGAFTTVLTGAADYAFATGALSTQKPRIARG